MQGEVKDVQVAAHSIVLPRGKFCISVAEVSPDVPADLLPGISVTAIPGQGDSIDFARLGGGADWLREPGDAVLLQVRSEQARVLLTSYKLSAAGQAKPPRMHIQRLDAPPPASTAAAPPPRPAPAAAGHLLVHVAGLGDRRGAFGDWLGEEGAERWLEGVQIEAPEGLPAEALEYQVVLGKGWTSPWSAAGEYCGSRGMTLPVQGLRVALRGDAARQFAVSCEARTVGGAELGPVGDGELCGLEEPEALGAIRVSIARRAPARSKAKK
jgi:hypothetical protein